MNKHTPGPWVVSEVQLKDWEVEISDGSIVTAAAMHVNDDACTPDEETMANARLIAAAPDLLDALNRLLDCPDLNTDNLELETVEAIKQAYDAYNRAVEVEGD